MYISGTNREAKANSTHRNVGFAREASNKPNDGLSWRGAARRPFLTLFTPNTHLTASICFDLISQLARFVRAE
jgi:hypothetical protein